MLFPGREGQDIAYVSVPVMGLTHDPPWQFSRHGRGCRHKAKIRSSKGQVQSQRLPIAHGDVRSALTRCFEQRTGNGVHTHDKLCALFMNQGADGAGIFQHSIIVGLLQIEARRVSTQRPSQRPYIRPAISGRNHVQFRSGGPCT